MVPFKAFQYSVCSGTPAVAAQESSAVLPSRGKAGQLQTSSPSAGQPDGLGNTGVRRNVPSSGTAPHPSHSPPQHLAALLSAPRTVHFHTYLHTEPFSSQPRCLSKEVSRIHLCKVKHKCEYTYTVITTSPLGPHNAAACTGQLLTDLTRAFLKKPKSL